MLWQGAISGLSWGDEEATKPQDKTIASFDRPTANFDGILVILRTQRSMSLEVPPR
jgi:hypothetical protein